MFTCPECGSEKIWKDGLRYVQGKPKQLYLCRSCGYRFSENHYKQSQTTSGRQICVSLAEGAKNLVKVETRTEAASREGTTEIKGLLVSLSFLMLKEGYRETTIYVTCQRLKHLVKLGAILSNHESVKEVIAKQKWQEGTKLTYVNAYARLCEMQDIHFDKPRYKVDHQKLPFIPTETELDQLISFEGDEYDVKVAETRKERIALLEAGFEWIGEDNSGLTCFRKRK